MKTFAFCLVCLPLASLFITSSFGYRKHPVTGSYSFHNGVDLRARSDTVYALTGGTVRSVSYDDQLGIHIRIDHEGFSSFSGHLSQVFITPGDTIRTGQSIGITGKTGRVTGEHLHFSVLAGGRWVDPIEFIYQLINNKDHE